ncbi:MAG: large subunit ribosomal protein [Candidatus Diapherotrites archaeon]|nr:large subunit ribosomal protein [Candidatus Diapherotrites archaeon]MDN5366660.1 large subunit ribosomal protein [Candidatus Diapherotrites archaeon]
MVRENILKKQKIVEELAEMITGAKTVAVASIDRVPADMMQKVRRELSGKAKIRVVKNRLLLRALEKVKGKIPNIEGLEEHINGQTAVIVTDMDPFKLFKTLKEFRQYAPVKAGQVAPVDIVVPKGITPVPAPMIAEIKAAGIPSKVTKGFVEVTEDYVAVRAGEVVPHTIADALMKLDVRPIEVMVRINAAWHDGIVFLRDVLDVSVEKVLEDLRTAAAQALNLAVNVGYPTAESIKILIAKAAAEARNLSINAGYVTKDTAPQILAKARAQALALASKLPPEALDESTRALVSATSAATPTPAPVEEKKEEEQEEEEKSEEDAAAGLASLFG